MVFKVATDEEIEALTGITSEQLGQWEEDATNGVFHGEPEGVVYVGRPLKFGQSMKQVGFKEPIDKIAAIDLRARELGMRRSDYLRYLVDQDLALAARAD